MPVATYAIGDVQGCFDELRALLAEVGFTRGEDRLWFVGDLVNRGPRSLDVLRFVVELGDDAVVVLGNHDLNLVAVAAGARAEHPSDTLREILDAPDADELIDWLARRPLLHREAGLRFVLVHAGLAPQWDSSAAAARAREVQTVLAGKRRADFLAHMYGNEPSRWSDDLEGWERLRFITNALTRVRYVDEKGRLDLDESGAPGSQREGLVPWFADPNRGSAGEAIVFGHWATLQLERPLDAVHGVYHLDTGCVWGGRLTALRLEDARYFSVASQQRRRQVRE